LAILADLGPRYRAHHADVLVVATEYAKELARPMLREECRRLAEPADVDPERGWRWGFVERVTTGRYLRWYGHARESATYLDTATLLAN